MPKGSKRHGSRGKAGAKLYRLCKLGPGAMRLYVSKTSTLRKKVRNMGLPYSGSMTKTQLIHTLMDAKPAAKALSYGHRNRKLKKRAKKHPFGKYKPRKGD